VPKNYIFGCYKAKVVAFNTSDNIDRSLQWHSKDGRER
jgi:hypothetical protein